jgi:flagellar hook-associated protein 2
MLEQLRGIVNSPATPASGGTLTMLSQVGISYQTDGTLKLDSSKLNSEMNKNFSDVSNLFSSATGFLTRMNTWSTSVLSNGGLISTRTANINTSIKNANDQISRLEYRMESLKKQYTTTYTNLNGFLNSMNNTSAYLTSQFFKGTSS